MIKSIFHPTAIVSHKTIPLAGSQPAEPQEQFILGQVTGFEAWSADRVRQAAEQDNLGVRFPLSQDRDPEKGSVVVEDSHRNSILAARFSPDGSPESLTFSYMGKPVHEARWEAGRLVDCRIEDFQTGMVTEFHIDRALDVLTFSGPVYE